MNQTSSTTVHLLDHPQLRYHCRSIVITQNCIKTRKQGLWETPVQCVCVFIHVFVIVMCTALALVESFKSSVNCGLGINSPTKKKSVIPRFQVPLVRNQRQEITSSHIPSQHLAQSILMFSTAPPNVVTMSGLPPPGLLGLSRGLGSILREPFQDFRLLQLISS